MSGPLSHRDAPGVFVHRVRPRVEETLASLVPERIPAAEVPAGFRPASVLIPLYPHAGEVRVLLTRRTHALPTHAGEISFPGGRREPGEGARSAALREAREEVGLDPGLVSVLGEMDEVWSVGGYLVRPFVGWLDERPLIRPDAGEIAAVLEPSLRELMDPVVHRVERMEARGRAYPVHFFDWEGQVIWGLTGGLLYRLILLLRGEVPAEPMNHLEALRTFRAHRGGGG